MVNPVEHVPPVGSSSMVRIDAVIDEDPSIATIPVTNAVSTRGVGIRAALVKIPMSARGGGGARGSWPSVASGATGGAVRMGGDPSPPSHPSLTMVTVNPVEHVPGGGSSGGVRTDAVNDEDPSIATFSSSGALSTGGGGIPDVLSKIPTSAWGGGGVGACEPWCSLVSRATDGAMRRGGDEYPPSYPPLAMETVNPVEHVPGGGGHSPWPGSSPRQTTYTIERSCK